MPHDCTNAPDWRQPSHYEPLRQLDRPGFAWELLRRNPAYREDHAGLGSPDDATGSRITQSAWSMDAAACWGLSFRGRSRPPGQRRAALLARRT